MGTYAISKVLPTNPNAQLAVAFGELKRDGLPHLVGAGLLKSRLKEFRSYGEEYLNVEFGWKPFLADIFKFADSVKRSREILEGYRKSANKRVNVHYAFPTEEIVYPTTTSQEVPNPVLSGYYYQGSPWGEQTSSTRRTIRVWFKGAFTFYLPVGDSVLDKFKRWESEANKLFGIRPTPEALWNLAPWSWATDWVSNLGAVVHNASAFLFDGLVMNYGYIMREERAVETIIHEGVRISSGHTGTLTMKRHSLSQQREEATPYGFGLQLSELTTRQKSIIAALGIVLGSSRHS
jgi:hypothetical protein